MLEPYAGKPARTVKRLQQDPLGHAREVGVPPDIGKFGQPDFAEKRQSAVKVVGAHFRVPVKPITPDELDDLARRMQQAPSADDRFELAKRAVLP